MNAFKLFALLVLLAASVASAQISSSISVSGRLTNSTTGLGLSGSVPITFGLYDIDTGGTALFNDTQSSVPVSSGLFHTTIAPGLPFNDDYWLELTVGGEILSPRQKMTPAPYAIYANKAGTATSADSLSGGIITVSGSDVVFGSTTTGSVYKSATDFWGFGQPSPSVQWDFFQAAPDATKGHLRVRSSVSTLLEANLETGKVGIGTTEPTQKLHVEGSINATGSVIATEFYKPVGIPTPPGVALSPLQGSLLGSCPGGAISGISPEGIVTCTTIAPTTSCTTTTLSAGGTFTCAAGKVLRGVTTDGCTGPACFITGIVCCDIASTAIA